MMLCIYIRVIFFFNKLYSSNLLVQIGASCNMTIMYNCKTSCGAAPMKDLNNCNIQISLSFLYTDFLSFTNCLFFNEYTAVYNKIKYLQKKIIIIETNKKRFAAKKYYKCRM